MTIPEFLEHLKHPEALKYEDTETLRDLVDRFPYCTSTQVLLAYGLFRENDLDFPNQLKKVAAYASSRKKLKMLFNEFQTSPPDYEAPVEIPGEILPTFPDLPLANIQHAVTPEHEIKVPDPPLQENSKDEDLLAIVRRRLEEIKNERTRETGEEVNNGSGESVDHGKKILSKVDLVEKFIHDKPKMSPPKASFFSPSEKAVKSNVDDEEIVTETLARLYYKQGNVTKAVKIYDKLILLYPEKSSYFAAQIEKMISPSS